MYSDAVRDPTRDYSQISKELESAHLHPVTPADPKDKSFAAFQEWQLQRWSFGVVRRDNRQLRSAGITSTPQVYRSYLRSNGAFAPAKSEPCKIESQGHQTAGFGNRSGCRDYSNALWVVRPSDQRSVHGSPRGGVFAYRVRAKVCDKQCGTSSNEPSEGDSKKANSDCLLRTAFQKEIYPPATSDIRSSKQHEE